MSEAAVQELRVAMTALADNPHVSEADFAAVCDAHLAVSQALFARVDELERALDLVDTPYPLEVFPERTDEQRDAIFAAMREVDPYATEWFYAHVARERGRVARDSLAASPVPEEQP